MPLKETYLDWAATSPPDSECLVAGMNAALRHFGNPSSSHAAGADARACLESSRTRLLRALGLFPGKIAFTGSGSEADAIPLLALFRLAAKRAGTGGRQAGPPLHLVTTAIEHAAVFSLASVLESAGFDVTWVKPDAAGIIQPSSIAEALRPETALVSVMAVNNETGAIQPLREIVEIVRSSTKRGNRMPLFHSDAVQALGKICFRPDKLGLDFASFSAHKIRGPRGVGALWHAKPFDPLAVGGGQEGGIRPGTENLQGAVAFALAAEKAAASLDARGAQAHHLEARLFDGLDSIAGAFVLPVGRLPGDDRYSPFIVSAAFPGLSGEVMQRALSVRGIAVSTGSACASRARIKTRRILDAMGISEKTALSAIRISTGDTTTVGDIDSFLEAAETIYTTLRT